MNEDHWDSFVVPQPQGVEVTSYGISSHVANPWVNYPHKRVMVTGSGGFIGSAVVTLLEKIGVEVVLYDKHHDCDILDKGLLEERVEGCGSVIHLAGVLGTHELFDAPEWAVRVNIMGSLNVMQACIQHGAQYTGITMPQVFPSIYTATKIATTKLADALHASAGLRCSHVRAFNAFGPGQAHGPGHPQKIVPTFAVQAWRGEPLPIWGDGRQGVDLIHTDDLANMLIYATTLTSNQVVDGGTGEMQRVIDVALKVCRIVGVDPLIQFLPMRRGETPTEIVAKGEGWDGLLCGRPRFRAEQLVETVMWYKDWGKDWV